MDNTVQEMGWTGIKNGDLLARANAQLGLLVLPASRGRITSIANEKQLAKLKSSNLS